MNLYNSILKKAKIENVVTGKNTDKKETILREVIRVGCNWAYTQTTIELAASASPRYKKPRKRDLRKAAANFIYENMDYDVLNDKKAGFIQGWILSWIISSIVKWVISKILEEVFNDREN